MGERPAPAGLIGSRAVRPSRWFVALLLSAILGGCAAAQDSAAIAGIDWRAVTVAGAVPRPDHPITLRIDGSQIVGRGGCNGYAGEARVENGRLVLDRVLITAAACLDPVPQDLEHRFVRVLQGRPSVLVLEGRLVLSDGASEVVFERVPG